MITIIKYCLMPVRSCHQRLRYSVLPVSMCLAMLTTGAQANFQYTFIEATYLFGEFEFANSEVDITGYELTAQFDLSTSFAVGINYSSLEGDDVVTTINGVDTLTFDGSGPEAYVLYHSPVGVQTDFILGGLIDMSDFEAAVQGEPPAIVQDEDTNFLFTGLRHRMSGIEFNAEWMFNLDAEDGEDEWAYTLGVLCGQPGGLQVGFQITPDDQGDVIGLSIRQFY